MGIQRDKLKPEICAISDIRREVNENCALLCCYAVNGGNLLLTYGDKQSVSHSTVKNKNSYAYWTVHHLDI